MSGWLAMVGVLCTLLAPSSAWALDGFRWQWEEGQERRYLLQANVRLPQLYLVNSKYNNNLRMVEFYTALVTRCTHVATLGKRAVELKCTFDDVQFKAAPPKIDAGKGIQTIVDEWDELLSKAHIQMVMGLDGQIRSVSLDGFDNRLRRFREIQETIRLMAVRAFAGLEIGTPRKGDDRGEFWVQKESVAFQLVSPAGSFGGVRIVHQASGVQGSVATIVRAGDGIISSGETVQGPDGTDRPRNRFASAVEGTARFDLEKGELVQHDYIVKAEPTASSVLAQGTAGTLYVQSVHAELIPEGAKVAPLGPNEETVAGQNGI